MPNNLERRVENIEDRETILYGYIDELRSWSKKAEEMIERIVEMNGNVLRLIDAMDDKMDGMDARMKANGI